MPAKSMFTSLPVSRIQKTIFGTWILSLILILYGTLSPDMHIQTNVQDADKILHSFAYTWLAFGGRLSFVPASRAAGLALGLICLGCALEIGQGFVPGRFFSVTDMAANTLGVGLGLVLAALVARRGPRFLATFLK